jgi:hypothetical protein
MNSTHIHIRIREIVHLHLKVPKRENFSLAFFALSEPTWVCDLEPGKKNRIFYKMKVYGFLPHIECAVKKKKNLVRPKLKVGCWCIGAHMCAYNVFFVNFNFMGLF